MIIRFIFKNHSTRSFTTAIPNIGLLIISLPYDLVSFEMINLFKFFYMLHFIIYVEFKYIFVPLQICV